ncbi:bifunctional alpha/beta hydrolase/class I SAM-dependent methyltransferase [Aquabacterium sp. A7-Y]|uniref:bifunctional alpha/beta hydrolase/class I SAM-dependent methyltransferase n=1 Tax=Aquabacterium sp. A7-Y TaxID=1349605 RepID=UPI00223E08D0|nr:bifunctional alpha/beta hydrolase/class I SAM-dependent methyltransferase [Aquabacterium sp. A7-Y]MCW7537533.1 bifunctional alpha/beta hydrolase/class I SAM-dependent methyltransferase [Aquabacterium sp. A7-Y]
MKRACTEHHFDTHDGQSLYYRRWTHQGPGPRQGVVVLLHRGHEHSGRMAHLVDELQLPGHDFYAWDARGHGRSPGRRGHSPSFATSVRDLQTFVEHLGQAHGVALEEVHVIAQSVGAVLAATWVHDYAPRIRGLTLASPAFKVKLYVPFARSGLKLLKALRGDFFVNSYVKARFLTHDAERIASYDSDPLITRPISANVLLGLYEAAERVVGDAAAITTPVQLLISGADWVVHQKPQEQFFERLSSPVKERHLLPGFYHDTLGERDRQGAVALIRSFVERLQAGPVAGPDLREAHRRGPTHEEAQALARPLPAFSPRGLYWGMTRAGLRLGGLLSEGVRLGHATGFDSGSTLDYVYRNETRGRGPLGRLIDRNYLDAIGWRGIRQRKLHVEELLGLAMAAVRRRHLPLQLLDIAAGHGRYVLDAIAQHNERPDAIVLRDYSDLNVRDGSALIRSRGLQDIARFVKADAFDRDGLATLRPVPTVAVVSGLYELFSDNEMVGRSLAGLAAAMPPGACLVYTNQPWHPQLELIARALTSHREGSAWVMRRRTQQEMDQLVAAAGFRKQTQRVDEWGIFTVSLAVRTGG